MEITAVEMDGQTVLMQDSPRVTAAARWTWRTPAGRCGVHYADLGIMPTCRLEALVAAA